jgi:hypothetical protein
MGYPYPGVEEIPMALWSVDDVERITLAGEDDRALFRALGEALQRRTEFPVRELTQGDLIYLMLWQRVHSYGHDYTVTYLCGETEENQKATYDLRTMDQIKLDEVYLQHRANGKALEVGGHTVTIDLLRVRHDEEVDRFLRTGRHKIPESLVRLAASLETINGESLPLSHRAQFVRGLSPLQYKELEAFHEAFHHGLAFDSVYTDRALIQVRCPNWRPDGRCDYCEPKEDGEACHGVRNLRLPFRMHVLIPRGSAVVDIKSKISRHGRD